MVDREYAPGRRMLERGQADHGVALLWHGRGVAGAHWMRPLADQVAARGVLALAADWSSEADDHGRTDLLMSLRYAREAAEQHGHDPDSITVAGWSMGGTAAMSLAMFVKRLGAGLGAAVLIAPGDGPRAIAGISGLPLPATMPPGAGRAPIDVVYGRRDASATPDLVTGLELRLRTGGWVTSLHEVDTDHAGIVGTRFDERREQYVPSSAAHAVHAVGVVATIVADAVSRASAPS
jgi:dienelactone hydrolase